ncbi:LPS assembly lipoprotein LptE [Allohahella marinimesophila]|uniref:LPS-assembly lipoprotein LptE n=1 Tax=Allohahella marinimesophila TaxID=1054972 RepID=UPI0031D80ED5
MFASPARQASIGNRRALPMRHLGIFVLLTSLLISAGCGFRPRGNIVLPDGLRAMNLVCTQAMDSNFCDVVDRQLSEAGVTIAEDSDRLPTLTIGEVRTERRAVSISNNAIAAEFQVVRLVNFSLTDLGATLIPQTQLAQSQVYRYDELSVLGKEKEEEQIIEDLDQQLSAELMLRLSLYSDRNAILQIFAP